VITMFDEWDPELTRAFAEARVPLADEEFMANLLTKIERARRTRLWRQILVIAMVVVFLCLSMRPVLENTASAVRFVGDFSPSYTEFMITPWGWAVSMLIGVAVVLRARPSRR